MRDIDGDIEELLEDYGLWNVLTAIAEKYDNMAEYTTMIREGRNHRFTSDVLTEVAHALDLNCVVDEKDRRIHKMETLLKSLGKIHIQ